jgi:hypothetical protein
LERDGLNPPMAVHDATTRYLAAEDAIGRGWKNAVLSSERPGRLPQHYFPTGGAGVSRMENAKDHRSDLQNTSRHEDSPAREQTVLRDLSE